MTDLKVIEQQGVRVLTTAQLAESYGTDTTTIKQNFNNNKRRYEEGKHYVLLKGADLQAFKNEVENFDLVKKNASALYLWTERGALLHAKSLNTDKAWEVYGELVETYFRAKKAENALQNLSPQLQAMINLEVRQNELESRVNDLEQRITETAKSEPERAVTKNEPKPWSEREKDYLRKAYALGQTDTEIAADMGRTVDSIKNKRRALGLCDDSKSKRHWRPGEDKKLIKYYNQGVSAYDIGQLLGRSLEGVEGRLHRLRKAGKV
ncbi:MAG: ORF6N domain-containing protein [Clostridia bacterium]|nr:ORF6N domain-containing protein [Clostridia bacterium]